MIEQVRQWLDTLRGTGQQDHVDACVDCGSVSPPGTNRCADCLGTIQAD